MVKVTENQKKVAKLIIDNTKLDKPLNGGEMLAKVGYSKGLRRQPSRILKSDGVKEALKDFGFTEDNAKKIVAKILLGKKSRDENKLKAAEQIFKVHGSFKEKENPNNQTNNFFIISDEQQRRIARRIITGDKQG